MSSLNIVPSRRCRTGPRPQVDNVSSTSPESWKWHRDPSKYTMEDERRILGKLVEVAVRTTFETHFYQWGGKVFRQRRGGAIGLKATGSVAKVAMEDWIGRLHSLLLEQGAKVYLLTKYVDDVLGIVNCVERGTRWKGGSLTHTEEDEAEDLRQGRSRQEVTLEVLKGMANTLTPFLKFTGEVAMPGSPIPVLDTLVWYGEKEGGRSWYQGGRTHGSNKGRCIQYAFYAKTMTNPLGILRRSALSEGTKVSTACAEILRRLKNFSVHADKDKVEDALITYMDNLIGMGYREEWRMKVIKSTLLGYERILTKVDRGESVRNREGSSTRTTRSWKRLMGPNTWFKVT